MKAPNNIDQVSDFLLDIRGFAFTIAYVDSIKMTSDFNHPSLDLTLTVELNEQEIRSDIDSLRISPFFKRLFKSLIVLVIKEIQKIVIRKTIAKNVKGKINIKVI